MPREALLKSYVTSDEKKMAVQLAKTTRLSVSEVVRQLVVRVDLQDPSDRLAVEALGKANADLARLGNLLKLGIAEETLDEARVASLLSEIRDGQREVREAVMAIQSESRIKRRRRTAMRVHNTKGNER